MRSVIKSLLNPFTCTENLVVAYEGDFTQMTAKSILCVAERNLESSGTLSPIKKRTFNVMIEALQNIVKHSDEILERENKHHAAIVLIGNEQSSYSLMSGNPIRHENIPLLQGSLEKINALDKEGLNELYKEMIINTTISEKGGAGLGLINMARKSGEKLEWSFADIDNTFSFFCLNVIITKAKK